LTTPKLCYSFELEVPPLTLLLGDGVVGVVDGEVELLLPKLVVPDEPALNPP
jgi:hypothetical protein